MVKTKFSLNYKDPELLDLVQMSDKKMLALWAIGYTERVMHYFDNIFPNDNRPQSALKTLKEWIDTGQFKMAVIRNASLSSHSSAREVGEDNEARSAARAAGQAVATAHVKTHSLAAANYALQAIHTSSKSDEADENVRKERLWQYKRLLKLNR